MTSAQLQTLSTLLVRGTLQMIFYAAAPRGQYGLAMWDLSVIGREIARPWGFDWQDQASQQVIFSPAMLRSACSAPIARLRRPAPRHAPLALQASAAPTPLFSRHSPRS